MINTLEALMIFCFGLSWPISIYRSYHSRTAKGKSFFFEVFLWIGYVVGILRKLLQLNMDSGQDFLFYLGLGFYCFNLIAITIDMALYLRNVKLDRARDAQAIRAAQE